MSITKTANGWPVIYSYGDDRLSTYKVPNTVARLLVRDDQAALWVNVALDFHKTIHSLNRNCWAYDPREPTSTSNHRSATANDYCSDLFPQYERVMNSAQRAAARAIVAKYVTGTGKRILEWGGDWSAAYRDEMHFQLSQEITVTTSDVASCIKRLKLSIAGPPLDPHLPPTPVPEPPAVQEDDVKMIVSSKIDLVSGAEYVVDDELRERYWVKSASSVKSMLQAGSHVRVQLADSEMLRTTLRGEKPHL